MSLYLMRHGECVLKEIDPDCPLSDRGMAEVRRTAELAVGKGAAIARIFHSGKKRALQTAMILQEHLKPALGTREIAGINPKDGISAVLTLIEREDDIVIVSHLPLLEKLTAHLVAGNQDKPVLRYPTAGMACLAREAGTVTWKILWRLMPQQAP